MSWKLYNESCHIRRPRNKHVGVRYVFASSRSFESFMFTPLRTETVECSFTHRKCTPHPSHTHLVRTACVEDAREHSDGHCWQAIGDKAEHGDRNRAHRELDLLSLASKRLERIHTPGDWRPRYRVNRHSTYDLTISLGADWKQVFDSSVHRLGADSQRRLNEKVFSLISPQNVCAHAASINFSAISLKVSVQATLCYKRQLRIWKFGKKCTL